MNDRLSIPLVRLFGGTVVADNDRLAAARVWINKVGRFRQRRFDALGAPIAISDAGVGSFRCSSSRLG